MAPDGFCYSVNYSSMNSRNRATLLQTMGLPLRLMWVARTRYTLPPKYMTHGFWLVRYQAMKDNIHVKVQVSLLSVQLFETPWIVAHQFPLAVGFSSKNTGVSCHSLHQGIILTQELNLGLPHCRQILYPLIYQGSPVFTWSQAANKTGCASVDALVCGATPQSRSRLERCPVLAEVTWQGRWGRAGAALKGQVGQSIRQDKSWMEPWRGVHRVSWVVESDGNMLGSSRPERVQEWGVGGGACASFPRERSSRPLSLQHVRWI